jgi:integrative and conjugative element protein (TIGR02256 family)
MFRRSRLSDSRVWIPQTVLETIVHQAAAAVPLETGGMLIGYADPDDDTRLEIIGLIDAGPAAVRKRHRFVPDGPWQCAQLAKRYAESGRIHTFIGDWHSHPGGTCTPSWRDRRTAVKVGAHTDSRMPRPLTLITAGTAKRWRTEALRLDAGQLPSCQLIVLPREPGQGPLRHRP